MTSAALHDLGVAELAAALQGGLPAAQGRVIAVLGKPLVTKMSLCAIGTPARGPAVPAAMAASWARAWARVMSGFTAT